MVTIRRFEPRCGVSRPVLEEEAKALAREVDEHLLSPLKELREQMSQRGAAWNHADEALHAAVLALPEGDRLAVQFLLIGDLHRVLEVYLECVRARQPEAPAPRAPPTPVPPAPAAVPKTSATRDTRADGDGSALGVEVAVQERPAFSKSLFDA